MLDSLTEGAEEYLQHVKTRLDRPDVVTDVIVGAAAGQLEEYVAAQEIELVVMTSHGRGGILRTALGSVADRMLGGQAPVVVVKPQEPAPGSGGGREPGK
jgi:nucleotide-binding universal stress UspA family protein